MATRMQQRKGTEEQWTSINPILASGEIGWESDTNKFKMGDGVNAWGSLEYFVDETALSGSLSDYVEITSLGIPDGVATLDGNGKLTAAQLPSIDEISQDAINTALVGGTGIDKAYDDEANTITLAVDSTIATKTYAEDYADGLAANYDSVGSADQALIDANAYTDAEIAAIPAPDYTGLATETYADTAAANAAAAIVDAAPGTLDTLNELAAALGDDANFATTVTDAIAAKADASHTHAISDVTSLQTTLDAKAPLTPSVNAKTSGYTLTAADKGEVITANGTFTITVPGSVFSAGDRVDIVNIGTGVITIAGSGATILSKDAAVTIDSQYAGATVLFGSPTVAYLIGAIA